MGVARVQPASGNNNSATTVTATFGGNVVVGNTIAVFIGWYNNTHTLSGVADNLGNGSGGVYTVVDNPTSHGNAMGAMAYATVTTGGSCTITATFGNNIDDAAITAVEINGVDTTTPLDNSQHLMLGAETPVTTDGTTTGNITTTKNGDFIFVGSHHNGNTASVGTNYLNLVTVNGGLSQFYYGEDLIQTSAGNIAGTMTPADQHDWVIGIMAFQAASAAGFTVIGRSVLDDD